GFEVKRGFGQVYPANAEKLGRPRDEEHDDGTGLVVQHFERGRMTWSQAQGLRVEPDRTREELLALTQEQRWAGYAVGDFNVVRGFGMTYPDNVDRLGRPLENERGDGGDGSIQKFERGELRWDPRQGMRVLPNA